MDELVSHDRVKFFGNTCMFERTPEQRWLLALLEGSSDFFLKFLLTVCMFVHRVLTGACDCDFSDDFLVSEAKRVQTCFRLVLDELLGG